MTVAQRSSHLATLPYHLGEALLQQAQALMVVGRRDEAEASARAAVEAYGGRRCPEAAPCLGVLGNLLHSRGQEQEACAAVEAGIEAITDDCMDSRTLLALLVTLANWKESSAPSAAAMLRLKALKVASLGIPTACPTCQGAFAPGTATPAGGLSVSMEACGHIFHKRCSDRVGARACSVCSNPRSMTFPSDLGQAETVTAPRSQAEAAASQPVREYTLRAAGAKPAAFAPIEAAQCAELPSGFYSVAMHTEMRSLVLCSVTADDVAILAVLPAGSPRMLGCGGQFCCFAGAGSDTLLCFGGVAFPRSFSNALWAVTGIPQRPVSQRVRARPDPKHGMPAARCGAQCVAWKGLFLVFGGATAFGSGRASPVSLWDAWSFMPDNATSPAAGGQWRMLQLNGDKPPRGLYCHNVLLLPARNEVLLLCGRSGGTYIGSTFAVALPPPGPAAAAPVLTVTRLAVGGVPPSPRVSAAALASPDGRYVLLMGGGSQAAGTPDAHILCCESAVWSPVRLEGGSGPAFLEGMVHLLLPSSGGGEAGATSSKARLLRRCALPSCGQLEARRGMFKACSTCKGVHYCCPHHQKEDWKPRHKAECGRGGVAAANATAAEETAAACSAVESFAGAVVVLWGGTYRTAATGDNLTYSTNILSLKVE